MNLQLKNEIFMLHPEKVLIWPKHDLVVIADIHLGKAETFLQSGLWLPVIICYDHANRILFCICMIFNLAN